MNKYFKISLFVGITCLVLIAQKFDKYPIRHQDENLTQPHPRIIFNSMTKSGSTYIVANLQQGLGYGIHNIGHKIDIQYWKLLSNKASVISKQHAWPEKSYVEKCKKYRNNRLVLHLRDPREAVLSLAYHYIEPKNVALAGSLNLPSNYFSLSWTEQIDWNIENTLPDMVNFIYGWMKIKDQEDKNINGLKILITTYDELLVDELQLYNKILTFYNIPTDTFTYMPVAKDEAVLFRQGDKNAWRSELSAQQKKRISEIVPEVLLKKFGWVL